MRTWRCQGCSARFGAWLSRCPRCGSPEELVVALSVCTGCTTKYAVGLAKCPHCGSTDHVEDGQAMPKNTVHGGPSSVTAGPDEPGYMPPAQEPQAQLEEREWKPGDSPVLPPVPDEAYPPDAVPLKGGEESSPGTDSSTSTETPQPKSEPSSKPSQSPAPTTASRSKKAATVKGSSARSTDGGPAADTSAADK